MPEVTNEEIKATVEALGKANEVRLKKLEEKQTELESVGKNSGELKEALAKITNDMADFEALRTMPERLKNIEAAIKRSKALGGDDQHPEDYKEAKASHDKWLRKGASRGAENEWVYEKHQPTAGQKSLSVQSDPDGGYMVLHDLSGRVIKQIFETSDMRAICSVATIGTDALEGTYDDVTGTSGGWVGERQTRAETDTPTIGKWVIPAQEQYAYPFTTQKMLDDANQDPEAWLADKIADIMGRTENTAFVSGDGVLKPRGFTDYASGTTLRTTIQRINSGASGDFTYKGLVNIQMGLKDRYRARAKWGMPRTAIALVMGMIDLYGRPLWVPQMIQGMPSMLLGAPIAELNDMTAPGSATESIAIADWMEAYQIVDRIGIRTLRDPYTNKPYVIFYSTRRVGGGVLNFEAIKAISFET